MNQSKRQTLVIAADSTITAIYSDDLRALIDAGSSEIKRASHVEPGPDGKWYADLSPVSGPVLGPFDLRQSALDAEVSYLEERLSLL